jgi:leucyl-tRNA synthetase
VDGKSEVGGFPVIRKPMRQWMLRITAYAEKLLADLDTIEWSDSLKEMQRNWIGRSEGAEVDFQVAGSSEIIRVFTTRPDTLFGATYMVLCPEHRLVDQITPASWPDGVPVEWTKGRPATQTASTNHAKEIAAKAAHFGAEVVDLNKLDIPIEVVAQIPSYLARKHGVIPVNVAAANLTVAVSDPSDLTTIDVLCRSLKRDLTIVVAAPSAIEVALQKYYRPSPKEVIAEYRAYAAGKSDLERTELAKEKTGVFTGAYAINPVNGEKIPIWIADYVLASYGTGAIMAVPAHDKRDFEFARQFKLPIRSVVARLEPSRLLGGDPKATFHMIVLPVGEAGKVAYVSQDVCDEGEGYAVNSTNPEISISGLPTAEAKKKITDWLEAKGLGEKTVNFKLRDWLFSRQRYWGEPFPIVWKRDANGDLYHEALPESALPLLPPALDDYKPTPDGQPPLARAKDWVALPDGSTRETNTMPQWAGSCWYYLRYLDAKNSKTFVGKAAENYWMGVSGHSTPNYQPSIKSTPGVDLYVGGTEHAVLHLLYARFWHKVLFDLGYVSTPEPFFKLVNQGLILGEDGQKMAKSRGNVVNPDDMVAGFGADAFRLYEMFMGPLQDTKPWNTKGVEGVYRFLGRVWRLFVDEQSETEFEQAETVANTQAPQTPQLLELIKLNPTIKDTPPQPAQLKTLHACVKKVTDDLDGLRFNTAISAMMVFINETMTWETKPVSVLREFLILLQPFAPHLAEELWAKLSSAFSLQPSALPYAPWPTHDPALLAEDTLKIAVQINGRLRDVIRVPANADNATLEAAAKASAKVKPFLDGKTIKKVIVVPKKLVNIVVA